MQSKERCQYNNTLHFLLIFGFKNFTYLLVEIKGTVIVVGVHALVVEPAASDVQTVGGACLRRHKVVRHTAGVVGGELASASILVHNSHSRFEVVLDEIIKCLYISCLSTSIPDRRKNTHKCICPRMKTPYTVVFCDVSDSSVIFLLLNNFVLILW